MDPNQQELADREFERIVPGISPGIRNFQMQGFQQVTLVDGQVFPSITGYVQTGPSIVNSYNNQQTPPGVTSILNPIIFTGSEGGNCGCFPDGDPGPPHGSQRHTQVNGQCIPDPDGQFLDLEECQEDVGGEDTDENGIVIVSGSGGGGVSFPYIHARLTARSTSTNPSFTGHFLWDWQEVFITSAGSTFSFAVDNSLSRSSGQYGSFPNGRAIELQGKSVVGDIVELTPFKGLDKKQWFTFVGREHPPLVIELGQGQLSANKYRYAAYPREWDAVQGRYVPHLFYKTGHINNFCEPITAGGQLLRDSYGQEMLFTEGSLILDDPITSGSLVVGMLSHVTDQGEWEYVFSERLNVRPVCEPDEPPDEP